VTQVLSLTIDATGLGPGTENTGTGRIYEELVSALCAVRPAAQVTVATSFPTVIGRAAQQVTVVAELRHAPPGNVVFRPRQILTNRELSTVMNSSAKVVLYQLDTISVDHDYFPTKTHGVLVRNVVRTALRNADVVATLTKSSAQDILRFCPDLDQHRIAIIPCGTDSNAPRPKSVAPSMSLVGDSFLLVLSASFDHKNRPFAIEVFAQLCRNGYKGDLVIAGPEPAYGSSVEREASLLRQYAELRHRVHLLGPVSEASKWWLLENASVVLYPSTAEGFGLVPFEAASADTPCLTADVSCFPEVGGPNVIYAKGFDVPSWAGVIEGWLCDSNNSQRQIDELNDRAAELTWKSAASAAWSAIDLCTELPPKRPSDFEGNRFTQPQRVTLGLTYPARAIQQVVRASSFARRRIDEKLGRRPSPRGY
jgi:glycosyltransferase involved in cell wall biosynthesis